MNWLYLPLFFPFHFLFSFSSPSFIWVLFQFCFGFERSLFSFCSVSYTCCTQNMSLATHMLCTDSELNAKPNLILYPNQKPQSHLPPWCFFSGGEGLSDCHWRSKTSLGVRVLCPRVPPIQGNRDCRTRQVRPLLGYFPPRNPISVLSAFDPSHSASAASIVVQTPFLLLLHPSLGVSLSIYLDRI